MYLYTIQGISSYWGDKYEYTEVELQRFVTHTGNDTIDSIGLSKPSQATHTSQAALSSSSSSSLHGMSKDNKEGKMGSKVSAPVSTMKLPCLDPYSYSLTHFSSLASDVRVCQSCCTALPVHSFSHHQQQEEEVGEYSKKVGEEKQQLLKVGYIR